VDAKVGVIYAVTWFDFPHIYGMQLYTDPLNWMRYVIEQIKRIPDVYWLLKPHPLEDWYSGTKLSEVLGTGAPPHIRMLTVKDDSLSVAMASDAIVTIHGTIGFEAVARGIPVIAADRSYYSEWRIAYEAKSRDELAILLRRVGTLERPSAEQMARASAFAY